MYAETGGNDFYTGLDKVRVGYKKLGAVPRLAICEELLAPNTICLMYCGTSWEVFLEHRLPSISAAMERAELGYTRLHEKWQPYRDLTADEMRKMEDERATIRYLNEDPALHAYDPSASQR